MSDPGPSYPRSRWRGGYAEGSARRWSGEMSKDRRSRPLWGRRISCWAGLLAAVTMTAAGCSGQQSVAHPDSQSSTVKVDPAHAALLRLPDGLTIRVPAGAVTRPGALSATVKGVPPVAAPSGMELTGPIYDLHLTGTTLRGDVTLSVPAPGPRQFGRTAGPDAALLAYFDPAGSWEPVNATYNAVTHVLTATTPHLSVWSVLRLNAASVLAAATDLLKGFFGKAGPDSRRAHSTQSWLPSGSRSPQTPVIS